MTGPLTVGVEEEFLLLDPETGRNVPAAGAVADALDPDVREHSRREFRHSMVEMVTPVCTTLPELREHLLRHRRAAAQAAEKAGACLVAVGATPVAEPDLTVTDDPRYQAIAGHYGPIVADPPVCGCHVHVGVPDRETAIQVGNHLRGWLPVVQAMSVNSPFFAGSDTGHASWRAMQLDRWPSLGPAPWLESAADFDSTVGLLVASGMMLDASLVLWHSRPSERYPTVEVRVADVSATADDAVLIAGLIRALVATALDDVAAGRPAPRLSGTAVRAAHWNAAHHGLGGTLLDPRQGRARPAWDLVGELLSTVRPALERQGDQELTETLLARLKAGGTGAERQRKRMNQTSSLPEVLSDLGRLTVTG